ncbi:hypothetical protein ACB092_02G137600 [Castanea dentata]
MASFFQSLVLLAFSYLIIPQLIITHKALAVKTVDATSGFVSLPLNRSYYHIQRPYDGYGYSSGIWQFEGHGYVPNGTSPPRATTLMLRVYNGSLVHYSTGAVLVPNIYNRRFKLNVIHDVDAAKLKVYIDGYLKLEAKGRGGTSHAFKCGFYAQFNDSYHIKSRCKHLRVLRKCD